MRELATAIPTVKKEPWGMMITMVATALLNALILYKIAGDHASNVTPIGETKHCHVWLVLLWFSLLFCLLLSHGLTASSVAGWAEATLDISLNWGGGGGQVTSYDIGIQRVSKVT